MQDEEASIRNKLHIYILTQIATPLRLLPPSEPPLLGDAFAISSRKLYEAIAELRSQIVGHLSTIPFDQLTAGFADKGTPKTPEFKDWCLQQRSEFRTRFQNLGSRLIDRQSQKMTVAARATAERKVFAHRS